MQFLLQLTMLVFSGDIYSKVDDENDDEDQEHKEENNLIVLDHILTNPIIAYSRLALIITSAGYIEASISWREG